MLSTSDYLSELIKLEEQLELYKETYKGVPIYRIFRFGLRVKYLGKKVPSFTNDNRKKALTLNAVCRNFLYSSYDLLRLTLTRKKVDNIIFPHFRLFDVNNRLLDKFTDPLIDNSSLRLSSFIFQQSYRMTYRNRRHNISKLRQVECIEVLSYIISLLLFPAFYFGKRRQLVDRLFERMENLFSLSKKDLYKFHLHFFRFCIISHVYKAIFRHLKVRKIFVVCRSSFMPQTLAAHQLGISVFELQHGVTTGNTILYSGEYNPVIDPDFFLSFGSLWRGTQFSIPVENIINIGFPYKTYIKNIANNHTKGINAVLMISSPAITEKIVCITEQLAANYKSYNFTVRCHPQEELTDAQRDRLRKYDNISFSDKEIESNIEVLSYEYVIGNNSSVLYEALCMGKKVGKLNFNGLVINRYPGDEDFFYLQDIKSFEEFVAFKPMANNNVYSDFDNDKFESLIN